MLLVGFARRVCSDARPLANSAHDLANVVSAISYCFRQHVRRRANSRAFAARGMLKYHLPSCGFLSSYISRTDRTCSTPASGRTTGATRRQVGVVLLENVDR